MEIVKRTSEHLHAPDKQEVLIVISLQPFSLYLAPDILCEVKEATLHECLRAEMLKAINGNLFEVHEHLSWVSCGTEYYLDLFPHPHVSSLRLVR